MRENMTIEQSNQLETTLRAAIKANQVKVLTIENAKALIGNRIQTIYFGYRDQIGVDDFIVGEIKREVYSNGKEGEIAVFTQDGRNTFIRAHAENGGEFTCSDIDRPVYFIIVGNED